MAGLKLFGMDVIVDPTMKRNELKMVSTRFDRATGKTVVHDTVRVINLWK